MVPSHEKWLLGVACGWMRVCRAEIPISEKRRVGIVCEFATTGGRRGSGARPRCNGLQRIQGAADPAQRIKPGFLRAQFRLCHIGRQRDVC